jgi:hypothetical protein
MGSAQGSCRGVVAWPDDGKEATAAGGHCSGQQDGSIGLGDASASTKGIEDQRWCQPDGVCVDASAVREVEETVRVN